MLLRVDLSTGRVGKEPLPERLLEEYIGGEALAVRILYDETGPETDPLGPECPLIIATGPLTGTAIGAGKISMVTKSCLTGLMVSGNIGGHFGAALKYAGYDALVVTGQSPKPVYLYINDGEVVIRDAERLWGKDTWETDDALGEECGAGFEKLCIGPGGERLVVNANLMCNRNHSGGRYGFGAGMGAKRLKAVAVRGTGKIDLADVTSFGRAMNEIWGILDPAAGPDLNSFSLYGSPGITGMYQTVGSMPTNNYITGVFDNLQECSGETYLKKYFAKGKACFGCRLPACMHWVVIPDGPHKGLSYEGPQAGTIEATGSMIGVSGAADQIRIHILCNRLGVCLLGVGFLAAWMMEAFERGALTTADTDGLELRWGDAEGVLELIRRVAYREGPFADLLASGLANAARKIGRGTEDYALTMKGQEMTPVAPTSFVQMGLAYAVNDRGPIHTHYMKWFAPHAGAVAPEVREKLGFDLAKAANRSSPEDKGRFVRWLGNSRVVMNSAVFCLFLGGGSFSADLRPLSRALSAATGVSFTDDSLLEMGERVINLERAYAVRAGSTRRNDTLPKRFIEEGFRGGGSARVVVPIEQMLDQYYEAQGWDTDTGIPTSATLDRLGLSKESEDLQPAREREASRPTRDAERVERAARRAAQNALYAERMASIAADTARAAAQEPGVAKRVKIRYVGAVCSAAGGIQEEEITTRVDTVGELLAEIRTQRPGVYTMVLDPSGTQTDRRRGIMACVPGGLAGPIALSGRLCDGIAISLT